MLTWRVQEERALFLKLYSEWLARNRDGNIQWGMFSKEMPGRVGYQVRTRTHTHTYIHTYTSRDTLVATLHTIVRAYARPRTHNKRKAAKHTHTSSVPTHPGDGHTYTSHRSRDVLNTCPQCTNFYRKLLAEGALKDPNYYTDAQGVLRHKSYAQHHANKDAPEAADAVRYLR